MDKLLLTLLLVFSLCPDSYRGVRAQETSAANAVLDQTEINVHPGQELLTMIQILAGKYRQPNPSKYTAEFRQHFSKFDQHAAVKHLQKIEARLYTDVPELGWCISGFPEPKLYLPETNLWYDEYGKETVQEYLKLALEFAKESDFWTFYSAHQSDYQSWAAATRKVLDSLGYPEKLADFYRIGNPKLPQPIFYIALDPLNSWGAHAVPHVGELNPAFAKYKAYSLGFWNRNGDETTIPSFSGTNFLSDLVWHEGSHIYLNEMLAKYTAEIEAISHLYNGDEKKMKNQSISTWSYCFEENLVRGIVIALTKQHQSTRRFREQAADELLSGFIYAEDIAGWLEQNYLNQRATSLEAMLPSLITWLGDRYDGVPK
ncbi:MAG: DUF4932 domain-containing protein [Bacteroidota bacterium]